MRQKKVIRLSPSWRSRLVRAASVVEGGEGVGDLEKQIGMVRIADEAQLYGSQICVRADQRGPYQQTGMSWIGAWDLQHIDLATLIPHHEVRQASVANSMIHLCDGSRASRQSLAAPGPEDARAPEQQERAKHAEPHERPEGPLLASMLSSMRWVTGACGGT
jgi:hypothetical protein